MKALANGRHSLLEENTFTGFDVEKKIREKGRNMSILEMGEREGLSARGRAALVSLTTQEDTNVRDSYGRLATTEPVRFILTATTNNMGILTDSTNHRRDPVIRIPGGHHIEKAILREMLPQLWAQACAELDGGAFDDPTVTYGKAVRLPRPLWEPMLADSAQHKQSSPLFEVLNQALNVFQPASAARRVTSLSIYAVTKAHGLRYSHQEFSNTMTDLGWEHAPKYTEWGNGRVWQRKGAPRVTGDPNAEGHRPVAAICVNNQDL